MASGYVYVLVNSSMPGLVKVGRTTRLPSERVNELSSATGVATPFIIAFEEPFEDCGAAEAAVHAELEHQGFRPAQNREFFRASPNAIIRVVLDVSARAINSNLTDKIDNNYNNSSCLWDDVFAEAEALLDPQGNDLQDVDEAIRLYKIAARMGSPQACRILGNEYYYGYNVREDFREALIWLKEGVKRGGYDCHLWMAQLFCKQEHFENAMKAFRKFFDELEMSKSKHSPMGSYTYLREKYVQLCLDYCLPIEFAESTIEARETILSRVVLRLTDRISVAERKELTQVRDALSNA